MQTGINHLGRGRFEHHLIARKHQKSRTKKILVTALSLTAMVDMFSVLVIFLLQTFSTSPEMMVVAKGVTLPAANTGEGFKDAPVLSISKDGIYLDQKWVGDTQELLQQPNPLMKRLAELREAWMKAHPDENFTGQISLQADRETPSTLISRFMAMLPSQAYSAVQLAVVGGNNR